MWGTLSDEKTCLSFTTAAGPRQRSHSRIRVPWDWRRPCFTVSDSRFSFLSPPTTRRATVEVFDPASTRDFNPCLSLSLTLGPTVSRPVCLGIKYPSGSYDQIFIIVWQLRVCWFGAPSLTRGRVCRLQLQVALASAVVAIFYCLRFETSLFVASYDSQGHGGGIRPRLHTGHNPSAI
jgi:hypothetical protein